MKVFKFGGTSLKNSQRFIDCANIIANADSPVAVVLSAPETVTNRLHHLIEIACEKKNWVHDFELLQHLFQELLDGLKQSIGESDIKQTKAYIEMEFLQLENLLKGISLIGQCPDDIFALIVSTGENLSSNIMSAILKQQFTNVELLDPKKSLIAEGSILEAIVNIELSKKVFSTKVVENTVYIMPGFIASNKEGKTVLLGRNGSDYSATSLAVLFKAEMCEIWTDVNGVFNCDPRLIEDANLLNTLSYQEAMELSYFGAKVLHPKTITPIAQFHIPLRIKNTRFPDAGGTLISNTSIIRKEKVKAISHLEQMTMINISGTGMKGKIGMAGRVFSCLSRSGISVTLITQSSSEYSISLCIHGKDSKSAIKTLEAEFSLELSNQILEPIEAINNLAIVSLIGDGMLQAKGVSARFLTALADASINVVALAQGSSERSISAVINSNKATAAINACHQKFFNTNRFIDLFLIGCGGVGAELLNQIFHQKDILSKNQITIRVCGIANSKKLLLEAKGIKLGDWQSQLATSKQNFNLEVIKKQLTKNQLINPVVVDCTSSNAIANSYIEFFNAGFHVVTANKKANSGKLDYYQQLRNSALENRRKFLYDTNVGAGLPVIENLQNLMLAGDKLSHFNGILSGSLSYIFGELENEIPFSKVTLDARDKGYTEPDPRDDLSGMDVARKLLILARESGLNIELVDITVESVLPKEFSIDGEIESFIQRLPQIDDYFKQKIIQSKNKGEVLRYVGSIDKGKCSVKIQSVTADDPLYKVKNGENALAFYSQYYQPIPLVLRGYGAGADVTAAGIYSDLLKTLI